MVAPTLTFRRIRRRWNERAGMGVARPLDHTGLLESTPRYTVAACHPPARWGQGCLGPVRAAAIAASDVGLPSSWPAVQDALLDI